MLDEFLSQNDIVKDSLVVDKICNLHEFAKPEALYVALAEGKVQLGRAELDAVKEKEEVVGWKRIFSFGKKTVKQGPTGKVKISSNFDKKKAIILTEDSIQNQYTLCDCCKPIPGDTVMGYIDDDKHVIVHKLQCSIAEKLKANRGNRVLAAQWQMAGTTLFPVSMHIKGFDKLGLLHEMTQVISVLHGINIRKVEIECDKGIFECNIQMYVHGTKEVDEVLASLRKIADLKEASRV